MLKFTLDTNCLIDIDEMRTDAPFVQRLLNAASNGAADVAMVASGASEKQIDGGFLDSSKTFRERMRRLGFGHIKLLPPLLRFDIGFWDDGIWTTDETAAREDLIFRAMFPGSRTEWVDHAALKGCDPDDETSKEFFKWRNRLLDAQAFWAHDYHGRDVFVTRDGRFRRFVGMSEFPKANVMKPEEAVTLL